MKNNIWINIAGASCFIIWGLLPLFWKLFSDFNSFEIVVHRIILSLVTLFIYLMISKTPNIFGYFKDKRTRNGIIIAAIMLLFNWLFFILATMSNRVLECSLAYYINPLIVIAFGIVFFKEKTGKLKIVSIFLALIGVIILTLGYGKVPWFSLIIASSFALYGLTKKRLQLDPYISLFLEMAVLFLIALATEIYLLVGGQSIYNTDSISFGFMIIILLSGVVTVLPLILYNKAVAKLSLAKMGFFQFITPTLMFLIGVFINNEPYTKYHFYSFILIWSAVIVFCISLYLDIKKKKQKEVASL